jgi:hypothetical protein
VTEIDFLLSLLPPNFSHPHPSTTLYTPCLAYHPHTLSSHGLLAMGIDGWYPFAENNNIVGTKVASEDTQQHRVEIDLLGLHYWLIISSLYKNDIAQERVATQAAPGTQSTQGTTRIYAVATGYSSTPPPAATASRLAQEIHRILSQSFDQTRATIHIDGARTREKQAEHQHRNTVRQTALESCHSIAVSNALSAHNNEPTVHTKQCWKKLKSSRPIVEADKQTLRQDLGNLGWSLCLSCGGESDVCIARVLHTDNTRYAVSRDSDMFFHSSVKNILRPFGRWFLSYDRANVLNSLGLNEAQMQLLAIVSKSDYAQNVRGKGLVRNHKFIKSLPTNHSLGQLLRAYRTNVGVLDTSNSMSIFVNRVQSPLSGQDAAGAALDSHLDIYKDSIHCLLLAENSRQHFRQTPRESWAVIPSSSTPPSGPAQRCV